jgi:Zn-dependent protease
MRFRIGKIPVRVQPAFFVVALLLGGLSGDLRTVAAWAVIVFGSVLLHELGHAAAGLAFGLEPSIELHTMGGTTSWASSAPLGVAPRVVISLAGPGAGFVVAAIVVALGPGAFPHLAGGFVYRNLLFVNLTWGLLNLVPMLPLDGGNVMRHLLNGATGGRGEEPARIASMAIAGASLAALLLLRVLGVALPFDSVWAMMLAAVFAMSNWRELQDLRARERDARVRELGTRVD